jgi:hypothetical protein
MSPKSKSYTTGDVLCVEYFPNQEDKTKGTIRWAICVEDSGTKVKIIALTKVLEKQIKYPKSFVVLKDSPDGKSMGLKHDSLIVPDRATETSKEFCYVNGKCPPTLLSKILSLI